jgi:hypothetical protein
MDRDTDRNIEGDATRAAEARCPEQDAVVGAPGSSADRAGGTVVPFIPAQADRSSDQQPTGAPATPLIPAQRRPVRDPARAAVVLRHARLRSDGGPQFCQPSRAELSGAVARRQGTRGDGKVIYPDRESAEQAAREFESLGALPMRSYRCNRSHHGHYHLTRDTATLARRADLEARIPRPRSA